MLELKVWECSLAIPKDIFVDCVDYQYLKTRVIFMEEHIP